MLREAVIFRATDELAGAIQGRAEEAGLSVSEYLRGIISQEVSVRQQVCRYVRVNDVRDFELDGPVSVRATSSCRRA